ncbi:GNAT family N-acetyltransferase [Tissierella sp. MB52-C2]|uniref:GNAT family N-acetyltransferase n=1 Tax=Tissierella sp. MB52-C2 TaxID=3070999 RepID=UPI00280C01B7|nr:GNAT family N-acetyltransferase [Tissierella sp. MB52-C2]WMM26241.1 GNAT family N-acetyltransferase [Tissierella sp. MB52-C2]
MEWINQLNKAIGYIELHLKEKLSYEEAAKACCCSLSKFQQIFMLSTGVTLSEYVRYRRMTIAAHELINTDVKIIDLALMLDYDSPEAFTRAYQAFHGLPPSITRKTNMYEEFDRIIFQMQVYGGKSKMGTNKILRIETEKLIIRKFVMEDWKDLLEIAVSNEKSPFADCDYAWPTDEVSITKVVEYFSKENQFWAVEVKELHKVVCFINFNFMDDEQTLDIGHVINADYLDKGYEYEALKALYNYGFIQLGAERIQADWALHDKDKLTPLLKLGMKIAETRMADKFRRDSDGNISKFEGCKLIITKADWLTNPAK